MDETTSTDELKQWTGLTDKWLRELAKKGCYPSPLKGRYQIVPTLLGLLKYYREQLQKKNDEHEKELMLLTKAKRQDKELDVKIKNEEFMPRVEHDRILKGLARGFWPLVRQFFETSLAIRVDQFMLGQPIPDDCRVAILDSIRKNGESAIDSMEVEFRRRAGGE
jgi:hypothetical protein